MSVVIVDWLGRGGIAQTTQAWTIELGRQGQAVMVATRPGRELSGTGDGPTTTARGGRVGAHLAVVRDAVDLIERHRPDTVVVQNYILPPLEWPVYKAAARAGARLVLVVHDDHLHSLSAGTRAGLGRAARRADVVVAHSDFVAQSVSRLSRRDHVVRIPLPGPVGMVSRQAATLRPPSDGPATALHFGVLRRGYKGTDTVLGLARTGMPGWRFRLIGNGAPAADHVEVVPGYVSSARLVAEVAGSEATVLPYRFATQSGAVVVSQALGSVVVSTRVGGIPEQIEDGVTGLLLAPGAPVAAWRDALMRLSDVGTRTAMRDAAWDRAWADHDRFSAAVGQVTGGAVR